MRVNGLPLNEPRIGKNKEKPTMDRTQKLEESAFALLDE